ncbi:MAG TPA: rhodanese-like domain-containing protein [Vicinamibacteria bacterium]|jgi:predicted sulfurtransferase
MNNVRHCWLLGVAVLVAAVSARAQPAVPTSPDQAPRVEAADVKRLVEKGEAVLVDVRGKDAWDAGHAEGALHIPEAQVPARLKDLPKEKLIALYCT